MKLLPGIRRFRFSYTDNTCQKISREDTVHQRGMSLIQLLLALTIVAIAARFSSPVYSALTENQRHQVAAEQLASSLRSARTEALLRHQYVVIYALEGDWSRGWRTILDLNGQSHLDKSNPVLSETQVSGRIPIAGNTPVKNHVKTVEVQNG